MGVVGHAKMLRELSAKWQFLVVNKICSFNLNARLARRLKLIFFFEGGVRTQDFTTDSHPVLVYEPGHDQTSDFFLCEFY